jgi:hypothetical protein
VAIRCQPCYVVLCQGIAMTELALRDDHVQSAIRSSTNGRGDHSTDTLKTDQTSGRAKTQGTNGRGFFGIIDGSNFIAHFRSKVSRY